MADEEATTTTVEPRRFDNLVFHLHGVDLPNELLMGILNNVESFSAVLSLRLVSSRMRGLVDACPATRRILSEGTRKRSLYPDIPPSVQLLEWSRDMEFKMDWGQLIYRAMWHGLIDSLEWLRAHYGSWFPFDAMAFAAREGHLEVVKWLHYNEKEGDCTINAMDAAAGNGHLEVVKWLHANRTEGCTERAMDTTAENGQLEVVKWLHSNRSEGCTKRAMDDAAFFGHLKVVQWLHENRTEGCTQKAMIRAAARGHLEVVKWLHHNRTEGCTYEAMDLAASSGHLKVVQWLHENRKEGCTARAMTDAAEWGYLDVVKWLYHHCLRESDPEDAMIRAATSEEYEVVDFLEQALAPH